MILAGARKKADLAVGDEVIYSAISRVYIFFFIRVNSWEKVFLSCYFSSLLFWFFLLVTAFFVSQSPDPFLSLSCAVAHQDNLCSLKNDIQIKKQRQVFNIKKIIFKFSQGVFF
jgi:hypothetical protein